MQMPLQIKSLLSIQSAITKMFLFNTTTLYMTPWEWGCELHSDLPLLQAQDVRSSYKARHHPWKIQYLTVPVTVTIASTFVSIIWSFRTLHLRTILYHIKSWQYTLITFNKSLFVRKFNIGKRLIAVLVFWCLIEPSKVHVSDTNNICFIGHAVKIHI